jgi:hypothetical protein
MGLRWTLHYKDLRKAIIRIYFDDEVNPSVEAPIGDFFGIGFGKCGHFTSLLAGHSSGGYYCYFPMPFYNKAEIEIENLKKLPMELFYSMVYYKVEKLEIV